MFRMCQPCDPRRDHFRYCTRKADKQSGAAKVASAPAEVRLFPGVGVEQVSLEGLPSFFEQREESGAFSKVLHLCDAG